ncbi:branched-chain amino acid ABC transporter permease [Nocardioides sp. AE5]|uniref:branched-chain amino acid ABC transporter permease n=1 Tax=Nocardioides sp. AE5 TaxID=2962573 RepID=UPI0028810284|nr:branched-chain amino acid ABC transporter permease [Nocardioides sp. AE5]MDT0202719.1 branched-chain amino acid ABC transporter permease [Nocardioides sp. AE5]
MDVFLQQVTNGLVLGGAYVLVTLGLFMVFTTLHLPNFAHGEMFALGAYLQYAFVVTLGIPFWIAMVLSVVVVGLIGWGLELAMFRRLQNASILAVLVGSLALAMILQELIALQWGQDPLAVPLPFSGVTEIGPVRIANYRLLIIGVVVAVSVLLGWLVYRARFGRSLRALAQNREMAQLSGLNVKQIGTITFVLGAAVAGLAGALLAPTTNLNPHMGFHPTLVAFVILVVAGGGGRMATIVIGGFTVAILETLAAGYIDNMARSMVVFVALVAFLALRPEGAFRVASAEKVQL